MADAPEIELLPAADATRDRELEAFFEACPGSFAQQTPGWRDLVLEIDRDRAVFLGARAGGRLVGVLPGYRFEGPLGAILCSLSQAGALGGVACAPGVDPEPVYRALLGAYLSLGRQLGCAFTTLATNPLWPDRERCERHFPPDYVLENWCQVLDLEAALGGPREFPDAGSGLHRNLRRAQSGGLRIDEEQTPAQLDAFYAIHAARQREIGAEPLPQALFTGALAHLVARDKARFFFVRAVDSDEIVGGGFYPHHGQVIDALMPAVATRRAREGTGFLLALHSMRWARARGIRFYNWQGSPPGGGVYRFKRQWGSRDFAYAFLTRVTGDPEPFLRSSVERVRSAYRWHYALPFDRIGAGAPAGPSTREAAWTALGRPTR